MADIVDKATRSRMMSGIKGKDTKPEIAVRTALHHRGFRYIKNDKRLPGKPDAVFPRYRSVVLVNGCYWHGHNCHLFKQPTSNIDFWSKKLNTNRAKDASNVARLQELGWRVIVVWECAIKGKNRRGIDEVADTVAGWLRDSDDMAYREIMGTADLCQISQHILHDGDQDSY